ncbi:hypothetical protein [Streptomyces europaeiscabiei]|nr:hypothetical protein [Streptomyces europaeiscabiei]MDX3583285.1 hypothetical protein [Streptomyces europaeiscabiei]MDX3613884.1 hypothetical protein [Streptomyces europaeiscabiei]
MSGTASGPGVVFPAVPREGEREIPHADVGDVQYGHRDEPIVERNVE